MVDRNTERAPSDLLATLLGVEVEEMVEVGEEASAYQYSYQEPYQVVSSSHMH